MPTRLSTLLAACLLVGVPVATATLDVPGVGRDRIVLPSAAIIVVWEYAGVPGTPTPSFIGVPTPIDSDLDGTLDSVVTLTMTGVGVATDSALLPDIPSPVGTLRDQNLLNGGIAAPFVLVVERTAASFTVPGAASSVTVTVVDNGVTLGFAAKSPVGGTQQPDLVTMQGSILATAQGLTFGADLDHDWGGSVAGESFGPIFGYEGRRVQLDVTETGTADWKYSLVGQAVKQTEDAQSGFAASLGWTAPSDRNALLSLDKGTSDELLAALTPLPAQTTVNLQATQSDAAGDAWRVQVYTTRNHDIDITGGMDIQLNDLPHSYEVAATRQSNATSNRVQATYRSPAEGASAMAAPSNTRLSASHKFGTDLTASANADHIPLGTLSFGYTQDGSGVEGSLDVQAVSPSASMASIGRIDLNIHDAAKKTDANFTVKHLQAAALTFTPDQKVITLNRLTTDNGRIEWNFTDLTAGFMDLGGSSSVQGEVSFKDNITVELHAIPDAYRATAQPIREIQAEMNLRDVEPIKDTVKMSIEDLLDATFLWAGNITFDEPSNFTVSTEMRFAPSGGRVEITGLEKVGLTFVAEVVEAIAYSFDVGLDGFYIDGQSEVRVANIHTLPTWSASGVNIKLKPPIETPALLDLIWPDPFYPLEHSFTLDNGYLGPDEMKFHFIHEADPDEDMISLQEVVCVKDYAKGWQAGLACNAGLLVECLGACTMYDLICGEKIWADLGWKAGCPNDHETLLRGECAEIPLNRDVQLAAYRVSTRICAMDDADVQTAGKSSRSSREHVIEYPNPDDANVPSDTRLALSAWEYVHAKRELCWQNGHLRLLAMAKGVDPYPLGLPICEETPCFPNEDPVEILLRGHLPSRENPCVNPGEPCEHRTQCTVNTCTPGEPWFVEVNPSNITYSNDQFPKAAEYCYREVATCDPDDPDYVRFEYWNATEGEWNGIDQPPHLFNQQCTLEEYLCAQFQKYLDDLPNIVPPIECPHVGDCEAALDSLGVDNVQCPDVPCIEDAAGCVPDLCHIPDECMDGICDSIGSCEPECVPLDSCLPECLTPACVRDEVCGLFVVVDACEPLPCNGLDCVPGCEDVNPMLCTVPVPTCEDVVANVGMEDCHVQLPCNSVPECQGEVPECPPGFEVLCDPAQVLDCTRYDLPTCRPLPFDCQGQIECIQRWLIP